MGQPPPVPSPLPPDSWELGDLALLPGFSSSGQNEETNKVLWQPGLLVPPQLLPRVRVGGWGQGSQSSGSGVPAPRRCVRLWSLEPHRKEGVGEPGQNPVPHPQIPPPFSIVGKMERKKSSQVGVCGRVQGHLRLL